MGGRLGSGPRVAGEAEAAERQLTAAHEALLQTRGLQFDFNAVPVETPPFWLEPLVRLLASMGPFLKYLFWGGLAVGAMLLAWMVVSETFGMRLTRRKRPSPPAGWRPDPVAARALLDQADRLAAQSQFEQAIHLILFQSIDDLAGRRPGAVRPAQTSRDLAQSLSMPDAARQAFSRITETVERSFFGGRVVAAEDFQRCRQDYEAFAFAEGWR